MLFDQEKQINNCKIGFVILIEVNIKDSVFWTVTPWQSLVTAVTSIFKVKESIRRNECVGRNALREGYGPT
jgi:hypothetical protein